MVTTIGLVGHVAGLIGQHHWNTQRAFGYDVVDGIKIPREDEQQVIREMLEMRKAGATYRGIADWMALTQERKMTFMGVKRVLVMEGMA